MKPAPFLLDAESWRRGAFLVAKKYAPIANARAGFESWSKGPFPLQTETSSRAPNGNNGPVNAP